MSRFSIGRLGHESGEDGLRRWESNGDRVSVQVQIASDGVRLASDLRQQALGLLGEGSAVPVRWTEDESINGFYRVLSADVVPDPRGYLLGYMLASFELERVQGFAAPLFQSIIQGGTRPGFDGVATPFHALPAAVKGYETGVATPTSVTRPSETGDVVVFTSGALYERATPEYFVPGENWYDGAATVSVNGSVVNGVQVTNAPAGWMLSNGRIRVVGEPGGWFRTERWDGAKWSSPGAWAPARRMPGGLEHLALEAPHTLTVTRNTPQNASVRLTTDAASVVPGERFAVTVDIELRRGALMANILLDTRGAYQWAMRTPLVGADKVLLTSGFVEREFVAGRLDTHSIWTSDGIAVIASSVNTNRLNVGAGYLPLESTNPVTFGQAVVNQWGFAQDETVAVVAR